MEGIRGMLTFGKASSNGNEEQATPQQHHQQQQQQQKEIVDRYKHDLEQAELIRRGGLKTTKQGKQKQKQPQNPHQKADQSNQLTEEDILLGLNGLDKADDLRERGDLEQSLKITKMSMELLIQFLKADKKTVLPNISRETISQRVQCALTDAEEMKRTLKAASATNSPTTTFQSKKSNTTTTTTTTTTAVAAATTSKALSKALAGAVQRVEAAAAAASTVGRQTAGQSTSSPTTKKKSSGPQHHVPTTTIRNKTITTTTTTTSPRSSVSKFHNSNDPMVQTVKSDLYIDQSQLQDVSWNDIAGLETAKQSLQENAILPMMRPDLFTGLRKPRNILLYGPPGTGKTMLVKAVAKESQCLLFICTASALTSKWHGEGEKLLRTLFQVARAAAPSIIFVDEMDALLSNRKSDGGEHEASRRFKTEFMTQVDGIIQQDGGGGGGGSTADGKHLLLVACTNCPWDIDPAVMRRFPRRIYIPLPDYKARKALLQKLLSKAGNHNLSTADTKLVNKRLIGFSGSDISAIASEASFGPIRSLGSIEAIRGASSDKIRPIALKDFDDAIKLATKSISKQQIKKYEDWAKEQGAAL